MDPRYIKILEQAQKRKNENKKFFDQLKKQAPRDLDTTCNQLHEAAFEQVDCLNCAGQYSVARTDEDVLA